MSDKQSYSYTLLRYVHDPMTAEFVNVGLVVYSPKAKELRVKMRHTYGRLAAAFPDLDRDGFRVAMRRLEREFERLAKQISKPDLFSPVGDVMSVVRKVLVADESSLQWSPPGTGITADLDLQVDRLFDRLVGRYDAKNERRRSDDDVWRPVRESLEARNIADRFGEKTISGSADSIEFRHAWKNGIWHCVQPLSFDLADDDGIKDKARRWTGHLAAVADAGDSFRPYFLIAPPTNPNLASAFETAVSILQKSPVQPEIYLEQQTDALVDRMESEIRSHDVALTRHNIT